jgi:putative addiction module killer protein
MIGFNLSIKEYLTPDGKSPFSIWLSKLKDRQARAIIRKRINRLRLGNFGDSKSVGDGIFEIRINFGPGYRVYFGQDGKSVIILLCGGDKNSQYMDIKKAQNYWKEYWR